MKKAATNTNRYILLPALSFSSDAKTNPKVKSFLETLDENKNKATLKLSSRTTRVAKSSSIALKVVDSIQEDGPKLVELNDDELADFRFSYPGLRIIPERFYRRALFLREEIKQAIRKSLVQVTSQLTVTDEAGSGLAGIYVVAFTDFENRAGASGTTNKSGKLTLKLDKASIQRIYVYPDHTYWGYFKKNFTLAASLSIKLPKIDPAYKDVLRYFYDTAKLKKIKATLRVAVIDTGVGPHKDLVLAGGANVIQGEDPADYGDNGEGHGTHVAGIIGADGAIKGVAAGVKLYSYRVFPVGKDASNFDIMKAIDQAVKDKCDLINMSLGEEGLDEGIISSIKNAYAAGTVCFAANGNEDRSPVSFPASYSLTVAVSAMGRKETFPANTVQTGIVHAPYGKDKANFIADFSNVGPETDLTAPGVGIISTYPNDRYAIMDGTSMACPAAVGAAARILSDHPAILKMKRNQERADEMQKVLSARIQSMGFGTNFEGKGMLSVQP
ncbi:MAG: S8 family serine peptidase [Williamsia sp.]|nr:S8 family serine peptidase [Williamsia sp.]